MDTILETCKKKEIGENNSNGAETNVNSNANAKERWV